MFNTSRYRAIAIQAAALAVFVTLILGGAFTAWTRMQEQGMAYGFGILAKPTGWSVSSVFADHHIIDPYWWTISVALINTVFVAVAGILLATIVGFSVGVGRHAGNPIVSRILAVYVETFRNVPLLLQLLFWYATFTQLPQSREAIRILPQVHLSNQGLFMPAYSFAGSGLAGGLLILAGLALVLVAALWVIRNLRFFGIPSLAAKPVAILLAGLAVIVVLRAVLQADLPVFGGFSFKGGLQIPIELVTIILSITVFSSAYIAEVVRGGLQAVPAGQWEAAKALALGPLRTYYYVALPIAFRTILPSLGNQYVFVVKSTALGIAVGFSDIFSASVVSITQSGQVIEFLTVLMGLYLVLNYSLSTSVNWLNRHLTLSER